MQVDRSTEQEYRQAIDAIVSPREIASFERRSVADSARMLAVIWLELAAMFAAANLLGAVPLAWAVLPALALILAIATRVNALSVVMHEGSHGFLARGRVANDRLCNSAAAWWMLHSVEGYRPTHRLHHQFLNRDRDPDRAFYALPNERGALRKLVLQDLTGLTAARRAAALLSTAQSKRSATPASHSRRTTRRNAAGKALAQLVILGQFVVLQGLWQGILFYALFWLVPVLCVFPLLLRLKTIAEHYDPQDPDPGGAWIARTSSASRWQDHLVGARMEYHFEHHVLSTVPYRGLKRLHERLESAGFFSAYRPERRAQILSGGYVRFVTRLDLTD